MKRSKRTNQSDGMELSFMAVGFSAIRDSLYQIAT